MNFDTCVGCGATFARPKKYATTARKFCSHPCYSRNKRVGYINSGGYRAFTIDGKEFLEHRLVAEQALGRKILPSEDVHHINGDKLDNRPANLRVESKSAHSREHFPLSWCIETAKALRAEGWTLRQVGEKFGVTPQAIHSAFKTQGLTRRYKTVSR